MMLYKKEEKEQKKNKEQKKKSLFFSKAFSTKQGNCINAEVGIFLFCLYCGFAVSLQIKFVKKYIFYEKRKQHSKVAHRGV